ncbi:hypothetical protein CK203_039619 [Vitis vinifera]|uniref:Uncharacterized protein n=1 Tax=Vitis vinifera TaxID=29760 RepID=A0A438HFV8_VITVI|nr:hypothetical protein CK203_039619 [Vitis vinifera]
MSDFFPLTKQVSVNMGGDPPTFVSAWLPFGTPESVVSCIQHLQEWMVPKTTEVVVVGIRYMMHTHAQLFKRLEVAEAMRAFISHHPGGIEEMRLKENGAIRDETDQLKEEREALEAKYKGAEQENSQLKKDVDELRKKELETEYQRQVDEMFFFDYHFCMKKNGIMHDIPSLPSDDEDAIPEGPPR